MPCLLLRLMHKFHLWMFSQGKAWLALHTIIFSVECDLFFTLHLERFFKIEPVYFHKKSSPDFYYVAYKENRQVTEADI